METVKAKFGQDAGNAVLGLLLANARFEASVSSRAAGAGVGKAGQEGLSCSDCSVRCAVLPSGSCAARCT